MHAAYSATPLQLAVRGYAFPLRYEFKGDGKVKVRHARFNCPAIEGRASPDQWIENILTRSQRLGLAEIPVTMKEEKDSLTVYFHFKNKLDAEMFRLAFFGVQQRDDLRQRIVFDQPSIEKINFCCEVILETCSGLKIDPSLKKEGNALCVSFNNNAQFALYLNAENEILAETNRRCTQANKIGNDNEFNSDHAHQAHEILSRVSRQPAAGLPISKLNQP